MKKIILVTALAIAAHFPPRACLADEVTFDNRTSGSILVRCISGGNQVSPTQEYRTVLGSGQNHSRSDFVRGVRAAVAWNADRSQCTAISFRVRDGMTLIIDEDPDGKIHFQRPCAACSGDSSAKVEPVRNKESIQVAAIPSLFGGLPVLTALVMR